MATGAVASSTPAAMPASPIGPNKMQPSIPLIEATRLANNRNTLRWICSGADSMLSSTPTPSPQPPLTNSIVLNVQQLGAKKEWYANTGTANATMPAFIPAFAASVATRPYQKRPIASANKLPPMAKDKPGSWHSHQEMAVKSSAGHVLTAACLR